MKHLLSLVLLLALAATAQAQISFGVGGGPTVPAGHYNDIFDHGFHVQGLVDFSLPLLPVGVRATAGYQRFEGTLTQNQFIGTLNGRVGIPSPFVSVYFTGGPSVHVFSFDTVLGEREMETYSGFNFGAGASAGVPFLFDVFLEIKYFQMFTEGDNAQFVPITVGIIF